MPTSQRETGDHRADSRTAAEPNRRPDVDPERRSGTRRWTTIVLEEAAGGWRATQTGVDVEGRGETAADAAADYCRRVSSDARSEPNGEDSNA